MTTEPRVQTSLGDGIHAEWTNLHGNSPALPSIPPAPPPKEYFDPSSIAFGGIMPHSSSESSPQDSPNPRGEDFILRDKTEAENVLSDPEAERGSLDSVESNSESNPSTPRRTRPTRRPASRQITTLPMLKITPTSPVPPSFTSPPQPTVTIDAYLPSSEKDSLVAAEKLNRTLKESKTRLPSISSADKLDARANSSSSSSSFDPNFCESPTFVISASGTTSSRPPSADSASHQSVLRSPSPAPSERSGSSAEYRSAHESPIGHTNTAKPRGRRWYVLMEIVESEQGYVSDLRVLIEVYVRELLGNASIQLSPGERKSISLNLEQLLDIHAQFAQQLIDIADSNTIFDRTKQNHKDGDLDFDELTSETSATDAVARCFLDFAPRFDAYQEYCQGHPDAVNILRRIQFRPEYAAFEAKCASLAAENGGVFPPPADTLDSDSSAVPSLAILPLEAPDLPRGKSATGVTLRADTEQKFAPLRSNSSPLPNRKLNFKQKSSSSSAANPPRAKSPSRKSSPRSRPAPLHLWRRSTAEIPPPIVNAPDPNSLRTIVPPVPPLPSIPVVPPLSPLASSSTALGTTSSKRLSFRDLLIKPIQRVCRYPLLLEQLRSSSTSLVEGLSPAVEAAITAARDVAQQVNEAQRKKEVAVKTSTILERLDQHPHITFEFLRELGDCILATSVDVIYRHPIFSPSIFPLKARFCALFVFNGYILLAKVRKNKGYQPQQWFPLGRSAIRETDSPEAWLSESLHIAVDDHSFEIGCSCREEKEIILETLLGAQVPLNANDCPESSLDLLAAQHAVSVPTEGTTKTEPTRRRRHSTLLSLAEAFTGPQDTSVAELKEAEHDLAEGDISISTRRQSIKRASTVSITSIFTTSDPLTPSIRRASSQNRLHTDRNLMDVATTSCLSARMQAQLRGDMFKPQKVPIPPQPPPSPRRNRLRTFDKSNPRRSSTLDDSFLPNEDDVAPVIHRSSTESRHRKTRSLPKVSIASNIASSSSVSSPLRSPQRKDPFVAALPQDNSDDEYGGSVWDEVLSSTHTDMTSVETHTSTRKLQGAALLSAMKSRRNSTLSDGSASMPPTAAEEPTFVGYLGDGITNVVPSPMRAPSLLRSLTSIARRRTKSTPTPISSKSPLQTSTESESAKDHNVTMGASSSRPIDGASGVLGSSFLSPYWTRGPPVPRPSSPVTLDGPPMALATSVPFPSPSGPSRTGMDLYRILPDSADSTTVTPVPPHTSHSPDRTSPARPLRTRRSFFSHLNNFTPMPSK